MQIALSLQARGGWCQMEEPQLCDDWQWSLVWVQLWLFFSKKVGTLKIRQNWVFTLGDKWETLLARDLFGQIRIKTGTCELNHFQSCTVCHLNCFWPWNSQDILLKIYNSKDLFMHTSLLMDIYKIYSIFVEQLLAKRTIYIKRIEPRWQPYIWSTFMKCTQNVCTISTCWYGHISSWSSQILQIWSHQTIWSH